MFRENPPAWRRKNYGSPAAAVIPTVDRAARRCDGEYPTEAGHGTDTEECTKSVYYVAASDPGTLHGELLT